MKIALVILHADSSRGGAERYTIDLAPALVARGHDVSILASSFQSSATAGRRVLLDARGPTRTNRYLAFLKSLDKELDQGGYDIVHAMLPVRQCDVYHPHAGIAAEAVALGHQRKSGAWQQAVAWIGNRFNSRRKCFAKVERELLESKSAPVVLCLSSLIQTVVRDLYPRLPSEKMIRLFNGTDLKRFDPDAHTEARQQIRQQFGIGPSTTVALMLAQDFERKGLSQAIAAIAQIRDDVVLLVGGRPDPSRYRRQAKDLGIEKRILFAGPVSDPVEFYQAADLFVLPTRFDPCSLVVLEAIAMGLPVISTTKNGACEIMQDGVHGYVLENPDDIPALAQSIEKVATMLPEMSANCILLRPELSQDTHLGHLNQIYSLIRRKRAASFGDLAAGSGVSC